MTQHRIHRVAELLRQAISDIVVYRIKDPRVQGITITDVQMSSDLKSARVYFSSLADGRAEFHLQGLTAAEGFIRRQLRLELDLKYIPALAFFYDTSFDNFDRINKILKNIGPSENE
ncbi:MAG: 30S ribosome-binding factor RbfA [Desulfomonile tiedjei]|uniref:Ribosome-binding factor A n=1 Tax=Desulfomonile tiedjei TaxID=2358 RepID=A0A9D6V3F5_9BACT|nr:30S ribosome-binding factor RbfA [Desulfomonile tiedjei]